MPEEPIPGRQQGVTNVPSEQHASTQPMSSLGYLDCNQCPVFVL